MPKAKYKLSYPRSLVKKPILFTIANECGISPSILKAVLTYEGGEMLVILEGEEESLNKAISMFEERGVRVEFVE